MVNTMKKLNSYISDEKISSLDNYIIEKLKIGKIYYTCQPKTRTELKAILNERLSQDEDADLNDIDVSNITNMNHLFAYLDPHNIDISQWDVSNVKNMDGMFYGCGNLECDLSDWDVSNVKSMCNMFDSCENFNCDLSNWDVSNVQDMDYMFWKCKKINCDLSNWNVTNERMFNMFQYCDSLKNKPSWYEKLKL